MRYQDEEKEKAWRKKLSEKAKLRGNNGNTMKGKHHSDISKKKIGEAASNSSQITRDKISKANKNRKLSDDHKLKISSSLEGKNLSLDRRRNLSKAAIRYWESLSDEEKRSKVENWNPKFENTKPELIFSSILENAKIEFVKQKWIHGYRVDFLIPKQNLIIEVQGCYYHGCKLCGHNKEWQLIRRSDDLYRKSKLESLGYIVKFVWECELKTYAKGAR